jgi:hypothetical protein
MMGARYFFAASLAPTRVGPSIHRDTCPPGRVPTTLDRAAMLLERA